MATVKTDCRNLSPNMTYICYFLSTVGCLQLWSSHELDVGYRRTSCLAYIFCSWDRRKTIVNPQDDSSHILQEQGIHYLYLYWPNQVMSPKHGIDLERCTRSNFYRLSRKGEQIIGNIGETLCTLKMTWRWKDLTY